MDWSTHALVLVLAILLLAQAAHCLDRRQPAVYVRWFGALTLLVVAFGSVLYLLLMSGTLVLSAEFGLVLVRGPVGWAAVHVLVASLAIGAAIGWHAARLAAGNRSRLALLLGAGVALALVSVSPLLVVDALNPQDPLSHRVYRYDIWWPPLLVWVSVCSVEAILTALKVESRPIRIWLVTAFVTALAYYALREPQPIPLDSGAFLNSVDLWGVILAILLPLNMGLGTWLSLRLREEHSHQRRWRRIGATLIAAVLGLAGASPWFAIREDVLLYLPWAIWVGWFVLLAVVAARRLYRAWRAKTGIAPQQSRPLVAFSVLMLVLLALTLTLPHVAHLSSTNPISVFTTVALGWIVLAEAILPGPLRPLAQWSLVQDLRSAESPLRHAWELTCTALTGAGKAGGRFIKAVFSAGSWPVALLKAMGGIVVIIALGEIPYAGKTVIQPFKVATQDKEPATDRLGQITSDHLQHALMSLQRDLQPEDIELGGAAKSSAPRFVPPAETGASAFSTTPALEIGPLKVPVALIAGLIQDPMRRYVLGVEVIDGTLFEDGTRRYSLLASSTTGMRWKVSHESEGSAQSVARLAELLALQIMRTDAGSGPRTDRAFDTYRAGLAAWRTVTDRDDWGELASAIGKFREATQEDPMFALAYYRLGMALLQDGQPGAAAEAFRAAVGADPALVAGRLALATTLVFFDSYYRAPAAAAAPSSSGSAQRLRYQEAHQQLLQVADAAGAVSGRNLASAYYGLCRRASRSGEHQLAYFYCQRAAGLYAKLRASEETEQQSRTDEATVLNEIGVILENSRPAAETRSEALDWHCSASTIDAENLKPDGQIGERTIRRYPYTRTALRYYERARYLLPDDQVIRCNLATASYAIGDGRPMKVLENDAAARRQLADSYRNEATRYTDNPDRDRPWLAPAYYRLALKEYHQAAYHDSSPTAVNPHRLDALNGYAYTFWQWRLLGPEESAQHLVHGDAEQAETYARQAVLLAVNKPKHVQAMARSTLGEVLLALARPDEAIEVLEGAIGQAPGHPYFHEIRWDLAQAYICAAESDAQAGWAPENSRIRRQKANALLTELRQEEQAREYRPFTDSADLLNPAYFRKTCARGKNGTPLHALTSTVSYKGARYYLRGDRPAFQSYEELCGWSGIAGDARDIRGEPARSAWLHVWGGGINNRIRADGSSFVGLGHEPRTSRWYYFAQLEDDAGTPVSDVYAVETKSGCANNVVVLLFDQHRSAPVGP
jgi:hypothetical protein